jgi:hypothetical protein
MEFYTVEPNHPRPFDFSLTTSFNLFKNTFKHCYKKNMAFPEQKETFEKVLKEFENLRKENIF